MSCCYVLGLANAFKIQVRARFTSRELRLNLPVDRSFVFRGRLDKGVISHFYSEGYHIEGTTDYPVRRVLDCGANIGDETARFLIHQPLAIVAAVELSQDNFRLLERNFGSDPRVRLFYGAVWACEQGLRVIVGNTPEEFRAEAAADSNMNVPVWTIPKLIKKLGWESIDILKIDIEGAEYELFGRGSEDWINKVNAIIFEAADNPASAQLAFRAFDKWPFKTFVCGENIVLIRKELPWTFRKITGIKSIPVETSAKCEARCASLGDEPRMSNCKP